MRGLADQPSAVPRVGPDERIKVVWNIGLLQWTLLFAALVVSSNWIEIAGRIENITRAYMAWKTITTRVEISGPLAEGLFDRFKQATRTAGVPPKIRQIEHDREISIYLTWYGDVVAGGRVVPRSDLDMLILSTGQPPNPDISRMQSCLKGDIALVELWGLVHDRDRWPAGYFLADRITHLA